MVLPTQLLARVKPLATQVGSHPRGGRPDAEHTRPEEAGVRRICLRLSRACEGQISIWLRKRLKSYCIPVREPGVQPIEKPNMEPSGYGPKHGGPKKEPPVKMVAC